MSLSDTAEYWRDVKSRRFKRVFTHIPEIDCGHFHVNESSDIDCIDCYACKEILKKDEILQALLEVAQEKVEAKQKIKAEQKQKHHKERLAKSAKHGLCTCGFPFEKRLNAQTKKSFLGCKNYPKCKNTKSI